MSQPLTTPPPCATEEPALEIPDEALPALETQQEAYDRLLSRAQGLDASEIVPFRADLRLAAANAREGHDAFAPHLAQAREIPGVDLELIENLGALAAASLFAQRTIDLAEPAEKTLVTRLSQGRKLRFTMLHQARAAVGAGLLPEGPVEQIAKGSGPIDAAEDLVALVALFKAHDDTLRDRIVLTSAMLDEAERLGTELQNELKPAGLPLRKVESADDRQRAIDYRNRFWTLLVQAHKETKRVADFLGIGDRVPSLQSRRPLKPKARGPAVSE